MNKYEPISKKHGEVVRGGITGAASVVVFEVESGVDEEVPGGVDEDARSKEGTSCATGDGFERVYLEVK